TYCREPGDLCENYIKISNEIGEAIANIRLIELSNIKNYTGLDQNIIAIIKKIENIYSNYILGFYITIDEDILVEMQADIKLENIKLQEGDIIKLSIDKAILLIITDIAKPIETLAFYRSD
ncbi:MAG: hypothetical protein QXR22_01530, partial [Acidilobaceae archaeon]